MIVGRDRIAVLLVASQHWGQHWAKYKQRGEPMPVANVYGWHPIMDFLAGRHGDRELDRETADGTGQGSGGLDEGGNGGQGRADRVGQRAVLLALGHDPTMMGHFMVT